jgi:V8-like Glu-specific endopeptidase
MRAEAAPTVRLLNAVNGACSAVVVAPGYALTALHCEQAFEPKVDGHPVASWRKFSAKDVALVRVPGLKCPCARVAPAAQPGERIAAIGFPFGIGLSVLYGESQGDVAYEDERYLHHSAPTMPGMSGGGVFVVRAGQVWLVAITSKGAPGASALSIPADGLEPDLRGL